MMEEGPLEVQKWKPYYAPPTIELLERLLKEEGYRTEVRVDDPETCYEDFVHEEDQVVWVVSGRAKITVEEEAVLLSVGDRALIRACVAHSLQVAGEDRLLWIAGFKAAQARKYR